MAREIKFRGKSVDNGEWIFGFYWASIDPHSEEIKWRGHFIHDGVTIRQFHEVDPESVGQFTGRKDKKGNAAYDGDIIADEEAHYRIYWCNELLAFDLERLEDGSNMKGFGCYENDIISEIIKDSIIIGNIHDNPKLINHGE